VANTNAPFGFRPVSRMGGSPFSVTEYGKLAADTHALYRGDLVYKVVGAAALGDGGGFNFPACASGSDGIAVVNQTLWLGASLTYGAASTLTAHPVTDEADMIYFAQAKTGLAVTTVGHVGKNAPADLAAGSTTTKLSGMSVGTPLTTATLDLKIIKVAMLSGNAEGDSTILEVLINKHQFTEAALGV